MKRNTKLVNAAVAGLLATSGFGFGISAFAQAVADKGECHGINACKGHGACGGAGHSCSGSNACKGQGWLETTEKECNDKKGKWVAKAAMKKEDKKEEKKEEKKAAPKKG